MRARKARKPHPFAAVEAKLRRRFPGISVATDAPSAGGGDWFLDVVLEGYSLSIQWSPQHGYGISAGRAAAYGEGADEVFESDDRVYARAVALLLARESTRLPRAVGLRELRRMVGISQVELAQSLEVQQPVISKREHCDDMMISTLRSMVEALGGSLEVRVVLGRVALRLDLSGTRLPTKETKPNEA